MSIGERLNRKRRKIFIFILYLYTCICTCRLGHPRGELGADSEAPVLEAAAVVVPVATEQHVGEAGLAHTRGTEDHDPGARPVSDV